MNSNRSVLTSIIIPNYNGRDLLAINLPAVIKAAPEAEIIVVDDASTDDSVAYLKEKFNQVKVLPLPVNKRFAAACNEGVRKAAGEIVVLLNNDVSPRADFLEPLVEKFTDLSVFAVGCREIQKLNGQIIEAGRAGGDFRRGLFTHWRAQDQNGPDTLWVSGGSGAFRKSLWEKLGGMDTMFTPAYEEDRDLCYRALKSGYKVLLAPESVVDHNHETTNMKAFSRSKIQASAHKNNLLVVWKNITDPGLLIKHLFWLPYHLIFTSIRTRGAFLMGFVWALTYLPRVLRARVINRSATVVSDRKLLTYAQAIL
jgi:GT2 family glycosyltransferase